MQHKDQNGQSARSAPGDLGHANEMMHQNELFPQHNVPVVDGRTSVSIGRRGKMGDGRNNFLYRIHLSPGLKNSIGPPKWILHNRGLRYIKMML